MGIYIYIYIYKMTTINFNNMPLLHVPQVEDITKKMPTSFEDFVQQEQKRIQEENAIKGTKGDLPVQGSNANKIASIATEKKAKHMKKDKQTKAKQAIADAIALTSRAAEKNSSNSVLPGGATA